MRFAFEEIFAQVSLLALQDISIPRLPRPTCNLETVDWEVFNPSYKQMCQAMLILPVIMQKSQTFIDNNYDNWSIFWQSFVLQTSPEDKIIRM